MKKIYLFLVVSCLSLVAFNSFAQIYLIDPSGAGGFELGTGFAANGWSVVAGNASATWQSASLAGTTVSGTRSAFVGPSTSSNAYTITTASTTHFYRDITVPAGATNIQLNFMLKSRGETSWDQLIVYTCPTTLTPTTAAPTGSTTTWSGATAIFAQTSTSTYTNFTAIPVVNLSTATYAGTTFRIVFTWKNDGSGGTQPPAAVDNISLTYCPAATTTATASATTLCSGSTLTLTGSTTVTGSPTYAWTGPTGSGITSTALTPGGVVPAASTGAYSLSVISGTCTYTAATAAVTVNATPSVTPTSSTICSGKTVTLSVTPTGGTWGTSNAAVATVTTAGVAGGVAGGTTTITYVRNGCTGSNALTVNQTPTISLSSTNVYCTGTGTTITATSTGSTYAWAPSATLNVATGTTVVANPSGNATYTCTATSAVGSCTATATNALVYHNTPTLLDTSYGGGAFVCVPGNTPYIAWSVYGSVYANYGSFSTSDPSIATVDASGIVNAVAAGNATISFTDAACATITAPVRVGGTGFTMSVTPSSAYYCTGSPVHLTVNSGGAADTFLWSPATGIDSPAYGIVNASPTTTTSYTVYGTNRATGCHASAPVTVTNNTPAAITGGVTSICAPGTTTWSESVAGGTWSSSATGVATVSSSGVVTAVGAGTATITNMQTSSGCYVTRTITVDVYPTASVSPTSACGPATLTASSAATYSWSPSTGLSSATSGTVTATPTAPTTYTVTMSNTICSVTATATITPTPGPITGLATVCASIPVTLFTESWESGVPTTAGTPVDGWSVLATTSYLSTTSGTPAVAAQSGSNVLRFNSYSASSGTNATVVSPSFSMLGMNGARFTFWMYRDGGYTTATTEGFTIYVNTTASTSGATTLGFVPRTYGTAMSGSYITGTSTTATAGWYQYTCTVPSTYTGAANYILIYANSNFGNDCYIDNVVLSASQVATITLAESATGGTWSSTAPTVATVTGGVVTGLLAGNATISYSNSCGTVTKAVSVLGVPGTIGNATTPIAVGSSATLTNATSGGTWSSVSTAVATVNSSTGQVFGVSNGTSVISYTTGCGSAATATITVNTPCSGTPTAGTATVSPTSGNASSVINLSLAGYSVNSGIAFQWQKSTTSASAGFANISGATNTTYSYTGITQQTWYQCIVTCTALSLSATSTVPTITYYPASSCTPAWYYGTAGGSFGYGCTDRMVVATTGSPFVLNGVSSSISDGTACTMSGYEDLSTSFSCTLNAGNSYTLTIGANTSAYSMSDQQWIDFNGNGIFESSESVGGSGTWTSATVTHGITIPSGTSVTAGTYRMRVETEYNYHIYPNLSPCPDGTTANSYYYGDVRDYKVTINALPPITAAGGATSICQGTSVTMSDATTGGTWSSSNTAIVAINATSGVATGGSVTGADTIYYAQGGIRQYYILNNLATPTAITGSSTLCVGDNITLVEAVTGGTWSSSATGTATVTTGGVVHGVAAGPVTISYSTGCGSPATLAVTVNSLPGTTTASSTSLCAGGTATLTNAVSGGSWITSDATVASVNASTGIVSAIANGAAVISYSMGCASTYTTTSIIVNGAPAGITPLTTVDMCIGLTTTLTNSATGGTWSSSATGIATVNTSTGVVGGVSAGTATITYSNGCGAPATRDVNVNTPPNATITGTTPLCQNTTTTLANTVSGGSWFSSNTAIATVDAVTGVVSGVAGGTATISYLVSGCNAATRAEVITPVPGAISGFTVLCASTSTTLTNTVSGGTWSSSNTGVATVNATTGLVGATTTTGTTTISYSNGCAPAATQVVTVSGTPGAITGVFSLCAPSSVTLFTESWESGVPTTAGTAVDGWNILATTTYLSTTPAGTPSITAQSGSNVLRFNSYSASSGTNSTIVSPTFSLSGVSGASFKFWIYRDGGYTTATTEGFTMYVNTTASTTGATTLGFVPRTYGTAISGTYLTGTSTTATAGWYQYTCTMPAAYTSGTNYILINVNSNFGNDCYLDNLTFTGTLGSATTLTDATPGGTWGTSSSAIVTINSASGLMTSVAAGNATISYTACSSTVTQPVVINAVPGAIAGGTVTLCQNATTTWTNPAGAGTWSSSNTAVASVGASTGVISGISGGTATITFSNGCGLAVTRVITVTPVPGTITGSTALCPGGNGTLINAVTGGTWTSGSTSVATVVAATGRVYAVSGVTSGTTIITYSNTCSPDATVTLTISGTPGAIAGPTSVCAPYTTNLLVEDWENGVPNVVGTPVDGWSATGSNTSYFSSVTTGASPAASPENGSSFLQWNSYSASSGYNATLVSPSFDMTGVSNATFTFWMYRDATGSYPAASYGAEGFTFYVNTTNTTTGATTLGFVPRAADGPRTGSITGTSTTATSGWYQYTCAIPATYTGSTNYILIYANSQFGNNCFLDNMVVSTSASSITLTDATPGGTWSTLAPAVASIGSSSGMVTGVASGVVTISYATGCGAASTATFTVKTLPAAITGSTNLCPSTSGTLANAAALGTWTSSDPSIATINSATGAIGATATNGTTTITYSNGCAPAATAVVTVSNVTAAIAGTTSMCAPISSPTLLSQDWETPAGSAVPTSTTAVSGWSQLTTPVNNYLYSQSTTGTSPTVSGPQSGSYYLGFYNTSTTPTQTVVSPSFSLIGTNGATVSFWVNRETVTSSTTYAVEGFTVLANTSASLTGATTLGFVPRQASTSVTGSYISGTSTVATAGWVQYTCTLPASFTGGGTNYIMITASSAGTSSSYYYSYLDNIKVVANPFSVALTDATPGGTWASSNATIASVNATSGVVNGLAAGSATITYTGPCGTPVTQVVTVNGYPGAIGGAGTICIGASLSLTNSATGGTWTSANTAIASVNSATGVVTGVGAGSVVITYANGCGSATTATVTVKSAPAAISGATSLCPSTTTNLSNTVTGGTWSSSNTSVATINTFSGAMGATATPGVTTITYTNGCSPDVTSIVTVSSATDTIAGLYAICASPTPLVYTSFETGVPSVAGTAVDGWNYIQGTGAANSYWSSVNASSTTSPASGGAPSGGGSFVAKFSSNTITSGNTAALVSPAFSLLGMNGGGKVSFYFYRDATAGVATNYDSVAVYVNTTPAVGGSWIGSVCRSTTRTTAYTGTAVAAGWYKYTYTIPATYTGATNYIVIKGYSAAGNNMYLDSVLIRNNTSVTTFTNATSGGTWSSSASSVATVSSVGVVSAVSAGIATITYTGACGSPVTHPITVNATPGANTGGSATICIGGTTTVANALSGGTWSSANPTIATVDASGNVTGIAAGTATISYFTGCGTPATTSITVNSLPLISSVTPSSTALCAGAPLTLTAGARTGTGTFVSYNWSGPAGYSTTSSTAAVTYTVPSAAATGLYSLTVTYAGNGCVSAAAQTGTVTVNDYPVVYHVTGSNGCSATGITVGLDSTQSAAVTYSLVLSPATTVTTLSGVGGGSISFAPVAAAGTYIVKATSAVGCQSAMSGADTVVATPTVASITPSATALCTGSVLTLTAGSVTASPTTYNWSGPGGYTATNSGTTSSLTVAPSASGIYTLTVNRGACYSSPVTSSSVTATDYPTVYNVTGGNGCTASGITVGLNGSQSTATYRLTLLPSTTVATVSGTSTSLSFSPVTTAGTYIVTATAGPASCIATMNGGDTIGTTPSISLGTPPNVCQPISTVSVAYSSAVASPTTYNVIWGSAALSAGFTNTTNTLGSTVDLNIPTGAAGSFDASVTVANATCTSSIYPAHIIVYASPTVTVSSINVPCMGYAGSIDFTGADSATVSYTVDGGSVNHFTFAGTTHNLSTGTITALHTYVLIGANNPVCSTTVNDTFTITPTPMAWIGGTAGHENEWSSLTNWTCGFVPTVSDDVAIGVAAYAPVVLSTDAAVVRNLSMAASATMSITSGQLDIKGNLTNNGSIDGSGKIMLSSTSLQHINGVGTVGNFDLSNTAGATIDTGSRMMIKQSVSLTSGTLYTNDSLELLSLDTTSTARIAALPSSGVLISGNVTSDQYIQGGYRRYRFLAHPFSDTVSLSMVNKSIDITGLGGYINGFTSTSSNSPSAFRLNPYVGNDTLGYDPAWRPFTKINGTADTNQFHPGQSIRIFMRGAKGEGLSYTGLYGMYVPSATTIKMVGHVNQGPVTVTMAKGATLPSHQEFNMLGNPYASPVDIGTILYNAKVAGEINGSAFYVWDPSTAGGGSYTTVPLGVGAPAPYYLPANCGFQVRANHDTAKLYFTESSKHATANNYLFKEPAQYVTLNVYDNNYSRWDMLRIQFNESATDANDNDFDAIKPLGSDFTFYSMTEEGRKLSIDARPYNADKVIPLGITSAFEQDFIIRADNIAVPAGGSVYLHDKLLDKVVEMKAGTEYKFTISKDKATQGNNRFELGMRPAADATVKGLAVSMSPNPTTDDVKITFTSGKKDQVTVRVMDMSGISIYNKDLGLQQNGTVSVPLSTFSSGIYMVELTQGSEKITKKLVKE